MDPQQRLIRRRPLRIAGVRLDCSHTAAVSQLDADDAMVGSFRRRRGGEVAMVAHSVFEGRWQIKKKP